MTEYTELKRLAQHVIDIDALDGGEPIGEAWDEYEAAATPAAVLALIADNDRLRTLRSATERDLAQELEVWRHGPSCWNCGDTGDVHDMVGEWRGQCDCNAAKLIDVAYERDQLRAEVAGLKTGYEAYERVNAELKAENEALRKDAELHAQIQRAAGELPGAWSIDISVERHAGWVSLSDGEGCEVELSGEGHLGEQVSEALEVALEMSQVEQS
ncbi:hypothetical protein VRB78_13675 [Pseudomonas trivialis]|uniref:hypothetical protein n=1 Tax=Pseudomonas trivialis TaxID=200450 RepID=UPI0030D1F2BE